MLAFLCTHRGLTSPEAVAQVPTPALEVQVRAARDIRPNDGFLVQLARLDLALRKERQQLDTGK